MTAEPPLFADAFAEVEPVYEEMPGWKESTIGVTAYDGLPLNARRYLERLQELAGVPIDIISTGSRSRPDHRAPASVRLTRA